MNDGIIKNDGTSRFIRSVSDFKVKYPTYDAFVEALIAGNFPVDVLFNENGWSQKPDFLNKASLLKDATAALFTGLPENPVPDDVFKILSKAALIGDDGELSTSTGEKPTLLSVETTTYVGTGKSGSGNPTSVTFSKTPEFIMVSGPANGSAKGPLIGMKNGPAVNVGKTSNSYPMVMTSTTWGPTVSWYESSFGNPDNQMNKSGVQYTAIGIVYK